ncbi:MAG: hypothetical protein ACTSXH_01215 [Promethearchaeota archaeon]
MVKEILGQIEQFETTFDTYLQLLKKNNDEIYQNISITWKKMQEALKENDELQKTLSQQASELTELRMKSEELDKTIEALNEKRETLNSKINKLNAALETAINDLKNPQLELENLISKLQVVNEKISAKENEKTALDQRRIENENKEQTLNTEYSKKMEELEKQIQQLKRENFFSSFLIDHSDEEIHEVDILAIIMEKKSAKLDELKKLLDIPPIMAQRTIMQLGMKGILKIDEGSGTVTLL